MDIESWIQKGKDNNYLNKQFILRTPPKYSNEYINWFNELKDIELAVSVNVFNNKEKGSLNISFLILLLALFSICIFCIYQLNLELLDSYNRTGALAGLLGSSIAVVYSIFDRYAQGFEDGDGNSHPIGAVGKSKYNHRMLPWFCVRPLLGAVMVWFIYQAMESCHLPIEEISKYKVVFWSFIGGLLAKSILKSLKILLRVFSKLLWHKNSQ